MYGALECHRVRVLAKANFDTGVCIKIHTPVSKPRCSKLLQVKPIHFELSGIPTEAKGSPSSALFILSIWFKDRAINHGPGMYFCAGCSRSILAAMCYASYE